MRVFRPHTCRHLTQPDIRVLPPHLRWVRPGITRPAGLIGRLRAIGDQHLDAGERELTVNQGVAGDHADAEPVPALLQQGRRNVEFQPGVVVQLVPSGPGMGRACGRSGRSEAHREP